jgi:hypothetical protein
LLLRSEFFLWGLATSFVLVVAFAANFFGLIDLFVAAAIMTVAVVATIIRWARYFLTYMEIDVYANEGRGAVSVQRLIPSPNLPERVEMSLQDAAEGIAEVNTLGIFNTLITVLRLGWLRSLSIGDLKLRPKTGVAVLEMFNIQNPEAVRDRIKAYWKKIGDERAAQQKRDEERETIRRMTIAVAQGIRWAQSDEFEEFKLDRDKKKEDKDKVVWMPAPPKPIEYTGPQAPKPEVEPEQNAEPPATPPSTAEARPPTDGPDVPPEPPANGQNGKTPH